MNCDPKAERSTPEGAIMTVPLAGQPDGSSRRHLGEVEVSITHRCTLACAECGFLVPRQPVPANGDPVAELVASLSRLSTLGFRIGRLVVLGGEPTINGPLLEHAVRSFRAVGIAEQIEVVSNGLTPQGLSTGALGFIDRFVISDYGLGDELLHGWKTWLGTVAPHVELVVRISPTGWDAWSDRGTVPAEQAQRMFETCWYRKHCITLERGRIFLCSRIAKLSRDDEGLRLLDSTTFGQVDAYLHRPDALPSCSTCTPMMTLPTVPAGIQPDNRLVRLKRNATNWLKQATEHGDGAQ